MEEIADVTSAHVKEVKLKKDGTPSRQGKGGGRYRKRQNIREEVIREMTDEIRGTALEIVKAEFWLRLAQDEAVPVLRENMALGIGDTAVRSAIHVLDRAMGKTRETHDVNVHEPIPIKVVRYAEGSQGDMGSPQSPVSPSEGESKELDRSA